MASTARALLSEFREVDQSFRMLHRSARERIATWDGSKGALDRHDAAAWFRRCGYRFE
jgi:hypothetical protein